MILCTTREQRPRKSCLDSAKGSRSTTAIVRYIPIALSPSMSRFIHHGLDSRACFPKVAWGRVVHPYICRSNNILSGAYSELKGAIDGIGLCTIDVVSFEHLPEQHIYLTKLDRISDRNRLPVILYRLTKCNRPVMRSLTISWATVQQHTITATVFLLLRPSSQISGALKSGPRACRLAVYPRVRTKPRWLIQRNRGSFADRPNVVGEQLSLQVYIYALKNVGMVSDSTRTLNRRSLGRNTIFGLSYKRAKHSVGDVGV